MEYIIQRTIDHAGNVAPRIIDRFYDINQAFKRLATWIDASDRIAYDDKNCRCDAEVREE